MKLLSNILTVFIILAMVAVGVLFALQNKVPVPLDLLVYTFEPRTLSLWILSAFALGGLLGMLVSSAILLRTRTSLSSARRQVTRLRAEVDKAQSNDTSGDAS